MTAVLALVGETRKEQDGVTLEEDLPMYRLDSLVLGVSIVRIRSFSATECLEEDHKVIIFWIIRQFADANVFVFEIK